MLGNIIAVIGGLGISLGMTYINARMLWDEHHRGKVRVRDGQSYWGHPPPNPLFVALGLLVALGWSALWISLPIALLFRAFGIYI